MSSETSFFELEQVEQISELERFSEEILLLYGIEKAKVKCVNYEYNATMRVSAENQREFALRININSPRNPANLKAEIAFVNLIRSDGRVSVAEPIRAKDGSSYISISHAPSGRTFHCVLYSWLPGVELADEPELDQIRAVGEAMAKLHQIAERFILPPDASLPIFSDAMWETEDYLVGSRSELEQSERNLIASAIAVIQNHVSALYQEQQPRIIHADFHGGNVLWSGSSLSVIDFDDCGYGLPVQDLATAIYYLDTPEQDAALREGYELVAPLPHLSDLDYQVFMMQRRIILLNYLYETQNDEHKELIPSYLEETLRRADKFIEYTR